MVNMYDGVNTSHSPFAVSQSCLRRGIFVLYYIICTTNAVVCGGMLAVIKVACCICTRKPGTSLENGIVLPAGFKITVSGVMWNRITEEGLRLLMVVMV